MSRGLLKWAGHGLRGEPGKRLRIYGAPVDATVILGGLGTVIGLVRAFPQFLRLLRTRDVHGVSLDAAATSSFVSFGWATYGYLTDQLAVTLATGSSGVVFALITFLAFRFGRRMNELRAAPVWLVLLVATGVFAGDVGLGVLLPVSVVVANGPQLLVAYRESDLTGLSLTTWMLSVSDGTVWMLYALVTGDIAILVFGILQLTTSSAIVLRKWSWARAKPAST